MGIQQNINQLLGSATVAAGLWAHSPGGKKYAETRQLKKNIENLTERYNQKNISFEEQEALHNMIRESATKLSNTSPTTRLSKESTEIIAGLGEEASAAETISEALAEERRARVSAEKKDIKNIRHQEFMNKILSGTPSEYLLNNQGGK